MNNLLTSNYLLEAINSQVSVFLISWQQYSISFLIVLLYLCSSIDSKNSFKLKAFKCVSNISLIVFFCVNVYNSIRVECHITSFISSRAKIDVIISWCDTSL